MKAILVLTGYVLAGLTALVVLVLAGLWWTSPGPEPRENWVLGPPMPQAFGELATVSLPRQDDTDLLVVMSGITGFGQVVDDVLVFDVTRQAWSPGPPLPAPRHHAAAAELDGAAVLSGGAQTLSGSPWQGSRTVWRWHPGDNKGWQALPSLPESRWGHRMVSHGGRLYVIGGWGASATTFVYRPDHEGWALAAPIPEPRDHLSVVVVGDRIWAVGGRNGESVARVDIYDPGMDRWSPGPPLPQATSGAAEAVMDGRIYIYGGEEADLLKGGISQHHWMLDTNSPDPQWQPAPPPPLAVHGADGAVHRGQLVIVGGASRHGLGSVLAWTPAFQILQPPEPQTP